MLRFTRPLCLLALIASTAAAQQPGAVEHAWDGNSQLHIQSIDVPPLPNAPFRLTLVTESVTIMPDGARRTIGNRRLIVRDSAGRVYQERHFLIPGGSTQGSPVSEIQIDDPNLHERTLCRPGSKTCRVFPYNRVASAEKPPSFPAAITLPNGVTVKNEDLGRNTIAGVDCLGSREIRTFPAKLLGTDHDEPAIKEFWYAPRLGIDLLTKRFDPRLAISQTFSVTDLTLTEPDPKTFAIPEGFHTVRMTD